MVVARRFPLSRLCMFVLGTAMALTGLAGCGGKAEKPAAESKRRPGEESSGPETSTPTRQENVTPEKLEKLTMPAELPAEFFYEGDGHYVLKAVCDPRTGYVKATLEGRISRAGKNYVGLYQSDRIQGPYKLLSRSTGEPLEIRQQFSVEELDKWFYRAVIFDADAQPKYYTDAVRADVSVGANASAQPKTAEGEKQAAPLRVAVLTILDDRMRSPAEMVERSITQGLTEVLVTAKGLNVCRYELVHWAIDQAHIQRDQMNLPRNHVTLNGTLQVDRMVFGTFQFTEENLKITLRYAQTDGQAQYALAEVERPLAQVRVLATDLVTKAAETLKVTVDPEAVKKFAEVLDELVLTQQKAEAINILLRDAKLAEAVKAFEGFKHPEELDPDLLGQMSYAYSQMGNDRQAARLLVTQGQANPGRVNRGRLIEILRQVDDFDFQLQCLSDLPWPRGVQGWSLLTDLIRPGSGRGAPAASAPQPQVANWPTLRPAFQVQSDCLYLNPNACGSKIVVFTTSDPQTRQRLPEMLRSGSGVTNMDVLAAEHFQTVAYERDGKQAWSVDGLFTPVVDPLLDGTTLYGVKGGALVAVNSKSGTVRWESKERPLVMPATRENVGDPIGRAWWKLWQLRVVGDNVIAWDPDGQDLHVFRKSDGAYVGLAHYAGLLDGQERVFLEKDGQPAYLVRGRGELQTLIAADLAQPDLLTQKLRLAANDTAVIQDGKLYELRRQVAVTERYVYYLSASELDSGKFLWVYGVLTFKPAPVAAQGKLFRYERAAGVRPEIVQVIDPANRKVDEIDLSKLGITAPVPQMAILDGTAVLLGSQAAMRASDYGIIWTNSSLDRQVEPAALGQLLRFGPCLVKAESGEVVGRMEIVPDFDWTTADVSGDDQDILVTSFAFQRQGTGNVPQGRLYCFTRRVPEQGPLAEEKPAEVIDTKHPTLDQMDVLIWRSRVVPEPGSDRWELTRTIAAWKFQENHKPEDVVKYLAGYLEKPAHAAEGPYELVKMMKPYVQQTGDFTPYVQALEKLAKAYPNSGVAAEIKTDLDAAKAEIVVLEKGGQIIQKLQQKPTDPKQDYACARGTSALTGSNGVGVAPPFADLWSQDVGGATVESVVMPVADKVLCLNPRNNSLIVMAASGGKILSRLDRTYAAAVYRRVVYVVRQNVEAYDLETGSILWRVGAGIEERPRDVAIAAGQDLCIMSNGLMLRAYRWDTGKVQWQVDLTGRNQLEVQGEFLLAGSSHDPAVDLVDLQKGASRWSLKYDAYAAYDGYLYTVTRDKASGSTQDFKIERRLLASATPQWSIVEVLSGQSRGLTLHRPVLAGKDLVLAWGPNVLVLNAEDGSTIWKKGLQSLQVVLTPPTVSAKIAYVGVRNGDLLGLDLTSNSGTELVTIPGGGVAAPAMADGVLYVLRSDRLLAMSGTKDPYPEDYIARLHAPTLREAGKAEPTATTSTPTATAVAPARQSGIMTSGTFQTAAAAYGLDGLQSSLTDQLMGKGALALLIDYGDWSALKKPLGDYLGYNADSGATGRQLGQAEGTILVTEVVQRRIKEAVPIVVQGIQGKNRANAGAVLEALTRGDTNLYGPPLLTLCQESLKNENELRGPSIETATLFGRWQYGPALAFLTSQMNDTSTQTDVRVACTRALGNYRQRAALTALSSQLVSMEADASIYTAASEALSQAGSEGAAELYSVITNTRTPPGGRRLSIRALANSNAPDAVEVLERCVANSSLPDDLRAVSAFSMGGTRRPGVMDTLLKHMNDKQMPPIVRNACLLGLGELRDRKVVPLLIEAMDGPADNGLFRRETAIMVLTRLTGATGNLTKQQWSDWYEANKDKPWRTGV